MALAADVFLQAAAGDRRLPRPSATRALAVFAIAWGCVRGLSAVEQRLPGPHLTLPLWSLPAPETFAPAATVLSQAFITALFQVCLLAIAVAATARYFPGWKRYGPAAALALLYAAGRAQSPLQLVYFSVTAAAGILVIEALVRLCAADLLTFGVALFWLHTIGPALTLSEQPAAFLRWNGVACVALAAVAGFAVARKFPMGRVSAAE